jgi:Bacterial regulatory proteins, luxR family
MNGCGDQECWIRHPELRPSNLARQNLELVPQHQQLNVLHVSAAAAPNKRTQESPKREVEKGEGHAADPPNPRAEEKRHRYWRPSGRSNAAIAAQVVVTPPTVEAHIRQILGKLDLRESPDDHRRVLAVLAYLRT